jgi:hypothetical protein
MGKIAGILFNNQLVEVVGDAQIEAVLLGAFVMAEFAVGGDGMEKTGSERGICAFEEFKEDHAQRVAVWS